MMTEAKLIAGSGSGVFVLLSSFESVSDLEASAKSRIQSLTGYAADVAARFLEAAIGGLSDPAQEWRACYRDEFSDEWSYLSQHIGLSRRVVLEVAQSECRKYWVGDMCSSGDASVATLFYAMEEDEEEGFEIVCNLFGWHREKGCYEDSDIICDE